MTHKNIQALSESLNLASRAGSTTIPVLTSLDWPEADVLARSPLNDGFTRREVAHHLQVMDDSAMTIHSTHSYVLVADRATRFFQRRYEWTGSGVETEPEVLSGIDQLGHRTHRIHGPIVHEAGGDRLLLLDIGRTMQKGDTESVAISHKFVDTGSTFKPFMGHLAYNGCKQITIAVSLPQGLSADVEFEVRSEKGASHPKEREPLAGIEEVDDRLVLSRYEKVIQKPVPGEYYSIVWARKKKK